MHSLSKWKVSLALFVTCLAVTIAVPAQTVTTLTTGVASLAPLVQGVDGNLYGVDGSIFKITPEGALSTVHTFSSESGGTNPTGLALGTDGNFYGTTKQGGQLSSTCPYKSAGCGTVFKLTPTGVVSLHSFSGTDGMNPVGGLTFGPDGNFYGTTSGTIAQGATGAIYGTVFKITSTGTFTTLHTFSFSDGAYPSSPLVFGTDGRLYGTTPAGGATGSAGTVFAITTSGVFTSLHSFDVTGAPGAPSGALVQAANGNFYGTTRFGGSACGGDNGTIYYISPGGHTFVEFYDFGKVCPHGDNPSAGLVLGSDGNFYGTAGGNDEPNENAVLFEITPQIDFTTLYTFAYDATSFNGSGINLMQDTNGTFYGTFTPYTGSNSVPPEIFSLSNGLSPFITTVPSMRGVGGKVLILGQGFTGATSVTFNGVAATFTVNSDTEITATVPVGATKGFVQVTTPSGTLSTKVIFIAS